MAKSASDKPTASADEALKRRKKQARQEAKLMLEIEAAKRALKKAQKKQSRAQARLEERSTSVHTLETRLAELRAKSVEPDIAAPPQSAELVYQQEQAELESSIGNSNGKQQASPETGTSTSVDEEQKPPFVEEAIPSEAMVMTNDVTEEEAVQGKKTATESDPSLTTTPGKASTQKTAAARTLTATKRPAGRSQSTRQSHSDAE
jgi:hypothetical protein